MCRDSRNMNKRGNDKSRRICYMHMYTLGSLVLREKRGG
jgi:hypothetical protein